MRVLFASWAWPTHFYPMVPLAWAFRNAGHQVAVASQPSLLPTIAACGLTGVGVGREVEHPAAALSAPRPGAIPNSNPNSNSSPSPTAPRRRRLSGSVRVAEAMVDDLVDLVSRWSPDLIVYEPTTYAAPLAAAVTSTPVIRHLWGVDAHAAARPHEAEAFAGLCARLGLAGLDTEGLGTVDPCPPRLQLPGDYTRIPLRYTPFNGTGSGALPRWLTDPPPPGGRICVTGGISQSWRSAPSDPALSDRAPSDPALSDRAPSNPAPSDRAPCNPPPSKLAPSNPALFNPTSSDAASSGPASSDPASSFPASRGAARSGPTPPDPALSGSAPSNSAPSDRAQPPDPSSTGTALSAGELAAALADSAAEVVLAVSAADRARLGPLPPNVRVGVLLPLALLLPGCDLLVSRGGNGSVMTAAVSGTPQLCVPGQPADWHSSEALAATGAGLVVDPDGATADTVRAAASRVLADPAFRAAAEVLRAEATDRPSPAQAVAAIEALLSR